MIKSIVHGLTIVRHAIAIVIVMGAAGATVAGAADTRPTHSADATQAPTTVVARVKTETEAGTKTVKATEAVQTAKPSTSKDVEPTKKPEPKRDSEPAKAPELENDKEQKHDTSATRTVDTAALEVLIKDCFARYAVAKNSAGDAALASEACQKAIRASGLSSGNFWTRFGPKVETKTPAPPKPEPTNKPTTTVTTAQLEAMVKECFTKYLIAKNTKEGATAASEACSKAIAASGLSTSAFWAKFGTPGSN